jgi:hypothetical protein
MSPEQTEAAFALLHDAVVKIDATLNDGLKAMVAEHRIELKQIRNEVETIRSTVTSHVAKEESSRAGEFHPTRSQNRT